MSLETNAPPQANHGLLLYFLLLEFSNVTDQLKIAERNTPGSVAEATTLPEVL